MLRKNKVCCWLKIKSQTSGTVISIYHQGAIIVVANVKAIHPMIRFWF